MAFTWEAAGMEGQRRYVAIGQRGMTSTGLEGPLSSQTATLTQGRKEPGGFVCSLKGVGTDGLTQ